MKVIFIPDNPYISKLISPSKLIEARTTEDDYIGFKTVEELLHVQKELEHAQVIQFDELTGLPLPLPKNTDRILEVEMLEHEGFTPCNLLGRSMCMKIKVLREIHYNPDTFEFINEPNE